MTRRRSPIAALVVVALAMATAWWIRSGGTGSSDQAGSAEPVAASGPANAVSADTPVGTDALAGAALPPETLPLSQRLAELERLAAGGHAEASCRLVVERLRCGFLRQWRPGSREETTELRFESQGQLEAANVAAEAMLLRLEQKKACGDAPPIESVGALALLGPAVASGHVPSALLYFELGHEFRFERDIYNHPHFDAWRRDAARALHFAYESGHPGAARALGMAYFDDGDFANGLVPDDARRAYLYLTLASRISGGRGRLHDSFDMGLDAELRAQLTGEAARMHYEHFGGQTYDGPPLSARGPYRQPGLTASDFCRMPAPE